MKRNVQLLALLAVTAGGLTQTFAQIPTPVSWWKGESNVVDSVGANNGAVYVPPAVSYVDGMYGQAFVFSGGVMSVPDAPDLKPANLTLQVWVRLNGSPGNYHYVVCKALGGAGGSFAIYTGAGGGAQFYVYLGEAGGFAVSPAADAAAVWDGNWHQLTGTWDGSMSRLYMDGVELGAGAPGTGNISYLDGQPLLFADYVPNGGANPLPYPGAMDELKLFNRALTAEEALETFLDPASAAGTNGLVAWWKGEGDANDSWGTHHGTAPAPKVFTFTDGRSGTAFFPKGGIAKVPDSASLRPETLTVSAWVEGVAPATFQYLLGKSRTGGGVSYAIYTGNLDGGKGGAQFYVYKTDGTFTMSPVIEPQDVWDGAWHLVTGTFDGVQARIYLDGLEIGTGTEGPGTIEYTSPTDLVIGGYSPAGDFTFTGKIDDIKVYDYPLTPEEVMAAYKEGRLVSWWRANQDANDSAGGNHGVMVGDATFACGRLSGRAFNTDGGSVQIPDSADLQPANLTLQALVNGSVPGADNYLISKSYNATDASYALYTGPDGGLAFYVTTENGRVVSPAADASIWDGVCHVVDGTYDGQEVRLYVDGKEVGSGTPGTGNVVYGTSQNAGKLLFGDFAETPSTANFKGWIDEVRLYGTALTAAEAAASAYEPILIVNQPVSRAVNPGERVTLSVTAQGTPPLSYQWQRYGTNLPGETLSSLVIPSVQPAQAGSYSVMVSGGTLKYTSGNPGRAFQTGAGGLIRVANAPIFETNNFTIQCWVRAIAPGGFKYLVAKARDVISFSASYAFYTETGALTFYIAYGPALNLLKAQTSLTADQLWDGNWHQLTGTWDGNVVCLYVDGVLSGVGDSLGGATIDFQSHYLNGDLLIGDVWTVASSWHFPGDIDEVKYFNHALPDIDVQASFIDPNGTAGTTGLVSWWKAEDNALDSFGAHAGYPVPPPGSVLSDTAELTVSGPANPTLTQPAIVGGNFQATVSGAAGQTYVILRSSDLQNWAPLTTNVGTFMFTDTVAAGSAARFSRDQAQ